MSATRTLNVITLSLILFLAGCLDSGDNEEEADENADSEMYQFSGRDAAGSMSEAGGDALVHIAMTQGYNISWDALTVKIVVDGGASLTCDEGSYADATSECVWSKDDDDVWSVSEEITISEGSDTNLCSGDNGGCSVDVTLTKIGVGNEDDKVIRTITAYADASN